MVEPGGTRKGASSVEFKYLTANPLEQFSGEWVAVVGEEVVAHGPSVLKVHARAMKARPGSAPLFAKIPKGDLMIL